MTARGLRMLEVCAALCVIGCQGARNQVKPPPVPMAAVIPQKERTADQEFQAGLAAFDAQKWDEALACFLKAVELRPGFVSAQFDAGAALEQMGKLEDAAQVYQVVLREHPDHLSALLNLGEVYRRLGQRDRAVSLYQRALEQPAWENNVQLLNNLSVVARLSGDYALAEKSARQVLSLTKDNAQAYKNLGLVYFMEGKYPLAEYLSQVARKLNDQDAGIHNNLGMIFLKTDRKDAALVEFQRAVQLDPNLFAAELNLGSLALSFRDYAAAEKAFSKAAARDPKSYEAQLYLAYALDGQKAADAKKGALAGAAFEKVLNLKPNQAEAICGAAWAYAADRGSWEKAVTFLERCKGLTQDSKQAALIDAKVKGLMAMKRAGPKGPDPGKQGGPKQVRKTSPGGSMIDKVSAEAAKQDSQDGTSTPP